MLTQQLPDGNCRMYHGKVHHGWCLSLNIVPKKTILKFREGRERRAPPASQVYVYVSNRKLGDVVVL
jgi:hypothetical protein